MPWPPAPRVHPAVALVASSRHNIGMNPVLRGPPGPPGNTSPYKTRPPDQPPDQYHQTNQHQPQGLCPMLDKPLVGVTRTFHRTLCNPPWPGHRHSLTIDFVEFRGCGVSCTLLRLSPHSRLLELALFRDCSGFSGPGRVWWVVVRVRAGARDLYTTIEKDT